ncbi:MAG TPA: recombinase family protein [Chloroflexota bacterium]|nr:recombinase family protein [Chloroflexota bacterium]
MPRKPRHKAHSTESGVIEALPYIRVSSDEQEREGLSLPAQLAACRRYAAEKGWVIGDEYQDVLTGTRDDRPHYQRLLADIRQRRAQGQQIVVVVKWLDRLGRRVLERVRSREELKELGVPVHTVMEGGEVSDLVANVLASVAEEEVRHLGERVSEVIQHTTANGWHQVGRAPWGYRWRLATEEERKQGAPKSVLEIAPEEAPYVQEAFRCVDAGDSARRVAEWVASLSEDARGRRYLAWSRVRGALASLVYIGRFDGDTPHDPLTARPGRWPALIEEAQWVRVQRRLGLHKRMPRQASGRYLLTGLIRCPRCGSRMGGQPTPEGGRYICIASTSGAKADADQRRCQCAVSAPKLNAQMLDHLAAIASLVSVEPRLQAALRREWKALREPAYAKDVLRELRRQEGIRGQAKKRLGDAAVKLVEGEIDKEGYDLARQRYERDLQAAEVELQRLRAEAGKLDVELPPLETVLADLGGWVAAMREMSVTAQRDILAGLVESVQPQRIAYGKYLLDVKWTPLGDALSRVAATIKTGAED